MDLEFEVYKGKKFSSVCRDIVSNTERRRVFIEEQLKRLTPMITTLGEAMAVYPLMTDLINASTKNDEQLVKFAAIIEKVVNRAEANGESPDSLLSDADIQELMEISNKFDKTNLEKNKKEENETEEDISNYLTNSTEQPSEE